jgi:choloylglycine hydrolase
MKSNRIFFFLLLFCMIGILSTPLTSQPCTTFCLDRGDSHIFGKNYDWPLGDGLVIVNKRGVLKTAIKVGGAIGQPANWTSKFGSVTFNQYGRELPMGGMNEAGLVVEMMALSEAEYPVPDKRPYVNSLQWIQYQLDNFSRVEEVIASDSRIRIPPMASGPGTHYLVSDRAGDCASIEFLNGKMVLHTRETLPVKALANSTYAASVKYWEKAALSPSDRSYHSLSRFARAANLVKKFDPKSSQSAVHYAFDILENVAQGYMTRWSIVYELNNSRISFRTDGNAKLRLVYLKRLDFACETPVKVLDINAALSGDVTDKFLDYTRQINRSLIGGAFRKTYFLSDRPEEELNRISRYPESTLCNQ